MRIQELLVCVYDYLLQQCEKQSFSSFWRQANATYRVHVIIQKNHCRLFPTSLPKITATTADDSSQESTETGPSRLYYIQMKIAKFYFLRQGNRWRWYWNKTNLQDHKNCTYACSIWESRKQLKSGKSSRTLNAECEMEKSKCRWQRTELIFFRFQQKHRSKGEIKSGKHEQPDGHFVNLMQFHYMPPNIKFPLVVWTLTFSFLEIEDLVRAVRVCREWWKVISRGVHHKEAEPYELNLWGLRFFFWWGSTSFSAKFFGRGRPKETFW